MLRRAFVLSSILGAVSAAAALAFAPDLSHVGRVVASLAPWKAQGFTVAPPQGPMHRLAPGVVGQQPDSLEGKFCRFPEPGAEPAHAVDADDLNAPSDSSALSLLGQSQLLKADSAAICTGTTPPPLQ